MKRLNKFAFFLSFIILVIACSAISMSSVAENHRWMLESINPLNGINGIAFTISYLLGTGMIATYAIVIGIFLLLWRIIYAIISGISRLIINQ